MNNINNFEIAKVQPQGFVSLFLIFCQFHYGVAYKKRVTHLLLIFANEEIFFQNYIERKLKILLIIFEEFFEWQK